MKDITETHNTARYFTENRHISWVLLLAVLMWGLYGYFSMPKAKDPAIQVRVASVITSWPGADATKIEQPRYPANRRANSPKFNITSCLARRNSLSNP